jgi:hypothetical protein
MFSGLLESSSFNGWINPTAGKPGLGGGGGDYSAQEGALIHPNQHGVTQPPNGFENFKLATPGITDDRQKAPPRSKENPEP